MGAMLALVGLATRVGPTPDVVRAPVEVIHESAGAAALRRGERLELNAASAAELELLPWIGPALAARIVAERAVSGPFRSVAELARVRGIGPRTLARIAPYVRAVVPPAR